MSQLSSKPVVLITGASGFIGRALIAALGDRYTLVGLDRAGPPDPPAPARTVDFDLGSEHGVDLALEKVRGDFGTEIAAVVHLAAYYDVSGDPNPLYDKITVQGTSRLIGALQAFKVEQFIFASTMLVHRPTGDPNERIDEDAPVEPSWAYPESKVRTEQVLRENHGSIPVVLLRIAGVYDDLGHSPFIAEQIARIYEHRLVAHVYPGMLCAGQSFVHLEDLTDAVLRLIDRRARLPQVLPLLVGEPEALGYAEVQNIIGKATHGESWKTVQVPKSLAWAGSWLQTEVLGDPEFIKPWMVEQANDHYVLNVSRAKKLLDWQPRHRLRDALPKMVAALKRDPVGWYRTNKLNPAAVAWYKSGPSGHGEHEHEQRGDNKPPSEGRSHGHMQAMEEDERRTRWAHFANIALGCWLAASPLAFELSSDLSSWSVETVTSERGLMPIALRSDLLVISDVISGLLIVIFGALSLSKRSAWFAQWANTLIGLWLVFAPLFFWSPSAAPYQND